MAVLASVAVAHEDILPRQRTRLARDPAIFQQADHARQPHRISCGMNRGHRHFFRRRDALEHQHQSAARGVARLTGIPLLYALRRLRPTTAQAGLSNRSRRQNVVRAFRSRRVEGKRILLIDDVMTTGATGASCALALKQAGANRVALLTVARVDRRMEGWRLTVAHSTVGEKV